MKDYRGKQNVGMIFAVEKNNGSKFLRPAHADDDTLTNLQFTVHVLWVTQLHFEATSTYETT